MRYDIKLLKCSLRTIARNYHLRYYYAYDNLRNEVEYMCCVNINASKIWIGGRKYGQVIYWFLERARLSYLLHTTSYLANLRMMPMRTLYEQ